MQLARDIVLGFKCSRVTSMKLGYQFSNYNNYTRAQQIPNSKLHLTANNRAFNCYTVNRGV